MLKQENKLGLFDHADTSHPDFVVKMEVGFKNFLSLIAILNDSVLAVRFCGMESLLLKAFPIMSKILQINLL